MGTTQRYLMLFSYVGSSFWGSQIQILKEGSHTRETVQCILEYGLKYIYRLRGERPIRVRLASRTDKGVHALKAALQVDLPPLGKKFAEPEELKCKLNLYFTNFRNIRVLEVYNVPQSFKVSSSVLDKTYLFRIGILKKASCEPFQKRMIPILEADRTYFFDLRRELDLNKVREATQLFQGEKDFGAIVGRPSKNTKPTICNIMSFTVEEAQPLMSFDPLSQKYDYYHFICRGNRFLYHMVRRMVSVSVSVGFNFLSLNDVQNLFDKPMPSSWPQIGFGLVSGNGLYLLDVNIDLQKINGSDDLGLEEKTEISSGELLS